MLKCIRCKEEKEEDKFPKDKNKKTGYRGYCKECCSKQKKEWSEHKKTGEPYVREKKEAGNEMPYVREKKEAGNEIPYHLTKRGVWSRHIKCKFGITPDVYDELLAKQNCKCAICGTETTGSKNGFFSIDHCHTTGKIRGLLCNACNKGLGFFKDNVAILQQASKYLI